jgi:hypothetical protein
MVWAVVLLQCLNLDPTKCEVKAEQPMFGMDTEAECREMLGSINYELLNHAQGTHVRPEYRRVKDRWTK